MLEKYNAVFNSDGTIKCCGREACKELIRACESASEEKINFGNADTGMMNVKNIQEFVKKKFE